MERTAYGCAWLHIRVSRLRSAFGGQRNERRMALPATAKAVRSGWAEVPEACPRSAPQLNESQIGQPVCRVKPAARTIPSWSVSDHSRRAAGDHQHGLAGREFRTGLLSDLPVSAVLRLEGALHAISPGCSRRSWVDYRWRVSKQPDRLIGRTAEPSSLTARASVDETLHRSVQLLSFHRGYMLSPRQD